MEEQRIDECIIDFLWFALLGVFVICPTLRMVITDFIEPKFLVFLMLLIIFAFPCYKGFKFICCYIEVKYLNKDIEDFNTVKNMLVKNTNEYNKIVEEITNLRKDYDTNYSGKSDAEAFDKLFELGQKVVSISECHEILEKATTELNKEHDDIIDRIANIEYRYGDSINIQKDYSNDK